MGGHRRADRDRSASGAPGRRPRIGARATISAVEPGRADDPGRWVGRGHCRAGRCDPVRPARPRLPRAGLRRDLPPQCGGGHPGGGQRLHVGRLVRPLLRSRRLLPHGLARGPGTGSGRPGPSQYRWGPESDHGGLAAESPGPARPGHRPRRRLRVGGGGRRPAATGLRGRRGAGAQRRGRGFPHAAHDVPDGMALHPERPGASRCSRALRPAAPGNRFAASSPGTDTPHPGRGRWRGGRARHRPVQPRRPDPALPSGRSRLPVAPQHRQPGRPGPPYDWSGRGRAGAGHGSLAHARLPGLRPGLSASRRGSGQPWGRRSSTCRCTGRSRVPPCPSGS